MKISFQPLATMFFASLLLLAAGCNILNNNLDKADLRKFRANNQTQLDSLVRRVGMNATLGVSDTIGFLAKKATQGLKEGLKGLSDTLDPEIKKIIERIGNLSEKQLDSLGERLESRLKSLKGEIKDEDLKKFLLDMVEEATGKLKKQTRTALSDMIQNALDNFDAETARDKLQIILTGALGDSTKKKAQELVNGALQPTMDTLLKRIDKIVHKDVPFVERQARKLLLALGAIALAIIGWIWYQRRRYAKLVSLLTYEIDKIPSQTLYDELTKRIRNEAQKNELEPLLRESLKESGLNT
ncbi:MAG: hypothetical protein H7246_16290 [Phycisphaerae bacterium]|nr:hypothetical protein [Saprospiraceae bacterium]